MIGICTDSNAQLPPDLIGRYGIEVVPLTVTIDGVDHLENVDLDADGFYAHLSEGSTPEISTAAPSPARFAEAYRRLAESGATEILSIHVGSRVSGTLNSAQVAMSEVDVPVHLVDTGSASFVVGCAVWEAADAVTRGTPLAEASRIAGDVSARCGNVFVVGALDLARQGGRLADDLDVTGVPVLALTGGQMRAVAEIRSVDGAVEAMADLVLGGTDGVLRVGVGHSDVSSLDMADRLAAIVADAGADVVRYRLGPSVGAHTGLGTAGAVFYRSLADVTTAGADDG